MNTIHGGGIDFFYDEEIFHRLVDASQQSFNELVWKMGGFSRKIYRPRKVLEAQNFSILVLIETRHVEEGVLLIGIQQA